jgi:hypothetical protein
MPKVFSPPVLPNMYQVQGDGIFVSYSTTSLRGQPEFSYQDSRISKTFTGDEIRVADSEIGKLVTVTTFLTVDSGSTSFTLVVPRVNLTLFETVEISTIGITTVHRLLIVGPRHGQQDFYTSHPLTGSASFFEF